MNEFERHQADLITPIGNENNSDDPWYWWVFPICFLALLAIGAAVVLKTMVMALRDALT